MTSAQTGLRERKKEQTRQLIASTARRLFSERGFEAVAVAGIARAADVAEKTVFNYFPTKEDLFYSRLEAFEDEMLAAIRDRAPGVSAVAAFTALITESPALLARERQVFARYAEALAALLAEETGSSLDDVEPWAVANALLGL